MKKGILQICALTAVLTLGGASAALGATGTWQAGETSWQYQLEDGTYAAGGWLQIDGSWYHFDADGSMQTGWYQEGGLWYYLDPATGAMVSGTVRNIDGKDYIFDASGVMTGESQAGAPADQPQQAAVTPSAGTWEGNVFTNNWSNYQITVPAGMVSDTSLGDTVSGAGGTIMDMSLFDDNQLSGLLIFYQDLNVIGQYTPESFLQEGAQSLVGSDDYTASNIYDANIGGFAYKKVDITMLGGFVHMDICCRQVDNYLMFVVPIYVEGDQAVMDGILGSMHAVR